MNKGFYSFSLQLKHEATTLSSSELSSVVSHTDLDRMWQKDLKPMLVVRYPGSTGSQHVQQVSVCLCMKASVKCDSVRCLNFSLCSILTQPSAR